MAKKRSSFNINIPYGLRHSATGSKNTNNDVAFDNMAEIKRRAIIKAAIVPFVLVLGFCISIIIGSCQNEKPVATDEEKKPEKPVAVKSNTTAKPKSNGVDLVNPVRPALEKFPRNSKMPNVKERDVCGEIVNGKFSAGRDLVYITDSRVWWESDYDGENDDECDHSMHRAMEIPFRRLVNLVESQTKWQLRVQETYRPDGVHSQKSLHKEGRALDVTLGYKNGEKLKTAEEMYAAYETLCKLAWQAGFDWVFYEYGSGTGPHVHASVKAERPYLTEKK
jgi:hypothetical protein